MLYRSFLGGQDVILECDVRLQGAAQALLEHLRILNYKDPPLHAGSKIRYGWSILTLRAESGFLRVCEPDFYGNPLDEISPTLDNTLKILEEQVLVLRRSGLRGVDVLFSEELFVRNRALEAPNLFLKRQQPARSGDSGWYIGNLDRVEVDGSENSYEIVRVFELLRRRPAVIQVLALPPDYLVIMRDDRVAEILDQDGNNYWS
jgi:hypothetical protein